jgi:hypothetical protein
MEAEQRIKELEEQKEALTMAYDEQAGELAATKRILSNRQAYDDIRLKEGREKAVRRGKTRYYTKIYKAALREKSKDMTVNEGYLICRLLAYVEPDTGYFVDGGFKMTQTDIIALVDPVLKERSVKDVLKSLVLKGYILTDKRSKHIYYLANPKYFFDGREENNNYKALEVHGDAPLGA